MKIFGKFLTFIGFSLLMLGGSAALPGQELFSITTIFLSILILIIGFRIENGR